MSKVNFKEVWKLPFKYDEWGYIWTSEREMVFTFDDSVIEKKVNGVIKMDNTFAYNFTNLLNGKDGEKISGLEVKDGCDLYMDGKYIGCFRGWGHLTGIGGLNLSDEDAAEVQDEFIADCLTKLMK